MRRALPPLLGVVIVVGGLFLLLSVFSGRDSAELGGGTTAQGPGAFETDPGDPPSSGPTGAPNLIAETVVDDAVLVQALSIGDVALVYGTRKPPPGLAALRERLVGGPFDPELAAAGQMAVLIRRPGVDGIVALAWQRRLQVSSADDPVLAEFIEKWLGAGRGNTG
jgi:hypothetical protein